LTLYNSIFTAFPLVARACFDQDCNYDHPILEKNVQKKLTKKENDMRKQYISSLIRNNFPNLYYVGQKGQIFNLTNYLLSDLYGLFQCLLMFFAIFVFGRFPQLNAEGFNSDFWGLSILFFTVVLFVPFSFLSSSFFSR